MEILSIITELALRIIEKTGYTGVFLLSALESAAIPIPSEVVLPFSGFLASSGRFNIWAVIIVATLANLAGSLLLFYLSKKGGRFLLEKYGKFVLISNEELERGDEWFRRYGGKAVFWGRLMPVIRTFISLPAGISGMNISRFTLLTITGALPWNAALALIGFKAGENWNILHPYFKKFDYLILIILIIFAAWYIMRHFKKKKHE